jgi:Hypervirulence associated proteins TUDOR domain
LLLHDNPSPQTTLAKRHVARSAFKAGSRVKWKWGANTAEGVIRKSFTHRIERTIKGSTVTRDADRRNPAYLIEQDDGDKVLKSHSELTHVS